MRNEKKRERRLKNWLAVQNNCCSYKRYRFSSQHTHGIAKPSLCLVPDWKPGMNVKHTYYIIFVYINPK